MANQYEPFTVSISWWDYYYGVSYNNSTVSARFPHNAKVNFESPLLLK